MNEPKFIPGPWEAIPMQSNHGQTISINDPDGCIVAEVMASFTNGNDKSKANADLIAAAPDMYAALRDILSYRDYSNGCCRWCGREDDVLIDCISDDCPAVIARAALKKANGQ